MATTRTTFNFNPILLHLLIIFMTLLQLAYAAPSPLQDTVVYPNANHHRHLHLELHPRPHLDQHHQEYPTNTYEPLYETEAQSTLGLGCRRLRLLGVHIRRCAEQMVSVAPGGSFGFVGDACADWCTCCRPALRPSRSRVLVGKYYNRHAAVC